METNRLILRKYDVKDLQDLYEYLSDPDVVKFEPHKPMTKEEKEENLAWRIRTDEMIAVELKENHRMKGVPYEIIAFGNIRSYKPVILWGNGVLFTIGISGI